MLEDLIEVIEHYGTYVVRLSRNIDLTTDAGISAARGLVNQRKQESRNTSRRISGGKRHAALDGKNHGGPNRPFELGHCAERVVPVAQRGPERIDEERMDIDEAIAALERREQKAREEAERQRREARGSGRRGRTRATAARPRGQPPPANRRTTA